MSAQPHTAAPSAALLRACSVALLVLGLVTLARSLPWVGARFPGFFVMPNRVIPSAGLAHWSGDDGAPLYQGVLLSVDDTPVTSAGDVYRRAAGHGDGGPVEYRVARGDTIDTRRVPLRTFGDLDYLAIFGAYFVTGLAYLALAAFAAERWHTTALYPGLVVVGWVGATFAFTGIDLYGPGAMFRVHALAEAFLPAATAHLALVYPRDRRRERPWVLPLAYGVSFCLAVVYQWFLDQPAAYIPIHNFCQAVAGVPVVVFAVALAVDRPPPKVERRARLLLAATVVGIVLPGLVFTISGVSGGVVPVNASAWTGFLFPAGAIAALRFRPAA